MHESGIPKYECVQGRTSQANLCGAWRWRRCLGSEGEQMGERELRVWAIILLFRSTSFLALLEPLLTRKHRLACPLKCHGCWQSLPTLPWMCSGGQKHTKNAGKWRALQVSVCTDHDLATPPSPMRSKERSCGLWASSWGMHSSCPLFQNIQAKKFKFSIYAFMDPWVRKGQPETLALHKCVCINFFPREDMVEVFVFPLNRHHRTVG